MPISCVFTLNRKALSELACSGFGTIEAFSGRDQGIDNPNAVAIKGVGPIPPGRYFIVDRETGGRLGWAHDLWAQLFTQNDHTQWFSLWNPKIGDVTMVNGVERGQFRLHPRGITGLSMGCITIVDDKVFDKLKRFIRATPPSISIPGRRQKAYGFVEVR